MNSLVAKPKKRVKISKKQTARQSLMDDLAMNLDGALKVHGLSTTREADGSVTIKKMEEDRKKRDKAVNNKRNRK